MGGELLANDGENVTLESVDRVTGVSCVIRGVGVVSTETGKVVKISVITVVVTRGSWAVDMLVGRSRTSGNSVVVVGALGMVEAVAAAVVDSVVTGSLGLGGTVEVCASSAVGWVRRRGAVVVVRRRRMMGGFVLGRDEAVRGSVLVQVVPVHVDGRHPAHAVLERPGPLAVLVLDFLY